MRRLFLILASLALAAAAPPASRSLVVLTDGPSFGPSSSLPKKGSFVRNGTTLRLREGDKVGILESGRYRLVQGPAVYVVGRSPSLASPSELANLLHGGAFGNDRRPRIAATRFMHFNLPLPPSLWAVDYFVGNGPECFRKGTKPQFFRRFQKIDGTITMAIIRGGKVVEQVAVQAPRGQLLLDWPFKEAPKGGMVMRLVGDSVHEASPRQFELRQVPDGRDSLPQLAADLLKAGCKYQLTLLTDNHSTDGDVQDENDEGGLDEDLREVVVEQQHQQPGHRPRRPDPDADFERIARRALSTGQPQRWKREGISGYVVVTEPRTDGDLTCRNLSGTMIKGREVKPMAVLKFCRRGDRGEWNLAE